LWKFVGADTGKQLPNPYPSGMWSPRWNQPDNCGGNTGSITPWIVEDAVHFWELIEY